jgi:hypothetical protein
VCFGGLAGSAPAPHVLGVISYTFVDGFTRVERDEAIERLKRAIAQVDGVIVDFAFFERNAIRLTVELDACALLELQQALVEAEVELFARCQSDLDAAKRMDPSHPIVAMLHVSFVSAEAEVGASMHPT